MDSTDEMQLLRDIKMLTGVVEVGLFCDMAKAAYFGNEVRLRLTNACTVVRADPPQDGSVSVRSADGSSERIESVPDVPVVF